MQSPAVERLIELALEEDIGPGDITTQAVVPAQLMAEAELVAKEPLVVAGLAVAGRVFQRLDPAAAVTPLVADGVAASAGQGLLRVAGRAQALLTAERTALNFLQRLSGVASHVRSFLAQLGEQRVRLVDTRKTTPGWRVLEKYAVRVGGAANHRLALFDGILIKNNHIAAAGSICEAVARARAQAHFLLRIEVEVEDLAGVEQALEAGADVIMLDNMELDSIRTAVARIAGRALVEVSGGVTRERLGRLAAAGVDIVSAGALTHAARSMDISMRLRPTGEAVA